MTKFWIAAVLAAALSACGSGVKLDEGAPVESRMGSPTQGAGAGAGGVAAGTAGQSGVSSVDLSRQQDAAAAAAAGPRDRVVYFDFDSFVVKDEYRGVIEVNARHLMTDRQRAATIEGHTDERGGREYNLALGQKRAEAVKRQLALLGVQDSQLEAVSYGKERPTVAGSTEEAWARNRRAEVVYR